MVQYGIQRQNSYNMDEKGFMLGVLGRSHRVFSKATWVKRGSLSSIQDGNRQWVTMLVTVCADGTSIPSGIILKAKNSNIRDN